MESKKYSMTVSTNGNDCYLLRISNSTFVIYILLFLALLGNISQMIASESGEILGPESGVVDLRWQSDDKVVALKYEYEFKQDKLNYDYGEIITVTYDIRVDPASRGYIPNRSYYLLSPYVTGYQISGSEPYCWRIIKSDIDTLEVITDNRSLQGEFTLQLVHYRDKSKPIQMVDGGFTYYTPIDTTRVVGSKTSRPPAIYFKAFRVATKQEGANVHQHGSGKFYFDQLCDIPLSGKTLDERTKKIFKSGPYVPPRKNNTYIPPQPDFQEIADGGMLALEGQIKVLKNTTLKWKISTLPVVITAVGFSGDDFGCLVSLNPLNTAQYILTTGNDTGSTVTRSC